MATTANDLRKGMAIKHNNDTCVVMDTQHRTPGNKRGFVQVKLRSLGSGRSFEQKFTSTDTVEPVNLHREKWEYSYEDHTGFTFMNPETYENLTLAPELVEEVKPFLTENLAVDLLSIDGKVVQIELPPSVTLKVTHSPEGLKGDSSSSNVMKPATLETGLTIQVPLFIKEGELIRVDTREKKYLSRA
jgi:elongation factor P